MPRLRAALLVAGALTAAACGGSGDDADVAASTSVETTTTVPDGATPPETGADPTAAVPEELDFVAPDVRGGQVVGADFAGQAMVIWFWAPW